MGQVPYGWDIGTFGELLRNEQEQAVLSDILKMHRNGFSLRQIASNLGAKGVKTKNGGKWHANTIRKIIDNSQS